MPEARRSFGSCIVSKGMIIHGGLTNKSHYLNDLYYFNLTQCKWTKLPITNDIYPEGVGF